MNRIGNYLSSELVSVPMPTFENDEPLFVDSDSDQSIEIIDTIR